MKTKNLLSVSALFFIVSSSLVYGWPSGMGGDEANSKVPYNTLRDSTSRGEERDGDGRTIAPRRSSLTGTRIQVDRAELSDSDSEQEYSGEQESVLANRNQEGTLGEAVARAQQEKSQMEKELRDFGQYSFKRQREVQDEAEVALCYWRYWHACYTEFLQDGLQGTDTVTAFYQAMEAARKLTEVNLHEGESHAEQEIVMPLETEETNVDKTENTFSPQHEERLRQGIKMLFEEVRRAQKKACREILNFAQQNENYWEQNATLRKNRKQQETAFKTAEEELLEVEEKNSEEGRAGTRLAQLARIAQVAGPGMKKAGAVTTVVGGTLLVTPLMPLAPFIILGGKAIGMAGGEIEKAAPALEEANKKAGVLEIAKATVHRNSAQEQLARAEKKIVEGRDHLLQQNKQNATREQSLFNNECKIISQFAKQICPQSSWNGPAWEQWIATVLQCDHAAEEVLELLVPCQNNIEYLKKITAAAWEQRRDESHKQWRFLESKNGKKIQQLNNQYTNIVAEIQKLEEEQKTLSEKQADDEKWKTHLETSIAAFENARTLRRERRTEEAHLKNIEDLEQLKQQLGEYPAQQEELSKRLAALQASEQRVIKKRNSRTKLYQLKTALARADFKADQEQFRRYWPEYDLSFRPYLTWDLPFPVVDKKETLPEEVDNAVKKTEIIESPTLSLKKLEEQGWLYFYEVNKEIEAALHSQSMILAKQPPMIEAAEQKPIIKKSFAPIPNLEAELSPSKFPSADEIERWAARKRLERCRKKRNYLIQLLQQIEEEKEEDQIETKTDIRTLTSWFPSAKPHSKASFLKPRVKSDGENVTVCNDPNTLRNQLLQESEEVRMAQDQWLLLVKKAEQTRRSLQNETANLDNTIINAWAEADHKAGQAYELRQKLLKEKQAADELYTSWDQNNQRWRALDRIMVLEKNKKDLEADKIDKTKELSSRKGLQESELFAEEEKIKNECDDPLAKIEQELKVAQQRWEELAKQHEQSKAFPTLKALEDFDRAVLSQWDQFLENQDPINPETVAAREADHYLQSQEKEECVDMDSKKILLARIEQFWTSILTVQQEEKTKRAVEAAFLYQEGKRDNWMNLTGEEREEYNRCIKKENDRYNKEVAQEKERLEKIHGYLEKKQKKSQQVFSQVVHVGQRIFGEAEQKLAYLKDLQDYYREHSQELENREDAYSLATMTFEDRKKYTNKKIKTKKEEQYRLWIKEAPQLASEARSKLTRLIKVSKQVLEKDAPVWFTRPQIGTIDREDPLSHHALNKDLDVNMLEIAAQLYEKSYQILNNFFCDEMVNPSPTAFMTLEHSKNELSSMSDFFETYKTVAMKSYDAAKALEQYMNRWYDEAKLENYYGQEPKLKKTEYRRVMAQSRAALMYNCAIKYKGLSNEAASAYYESAKAYEGELELRLQGNEQAAVCQNKRALLLGGSKMQPGAGWLYKHVSKDMIYFGRLKVNSLDFSPSISLLGLKFTISRTYDPKESTVLVENELRLLGISLSTQKKYTYKSAIETCVAIANILEHAIRASIRGDLITAQLHEKQAAITAAYHHARRDPVVNSKIISAYYKAGAALDGALGQGLFASFHLSKEERNHYEQQSNLFVRAAQGYAKAVDPKNKATATIYDQLGERLEEEAEFLRNVDKMEQLEEKIKLLNTATGPLL